jgi:hypothetical protein
MCDTHAYPGSALGVLLSRTALDLAIRASQYALTYPIEIPELSHLPCAFRVQPSPKFSLHLWLAKPTLCRRHLLKQSLGC